MSEERKTVRRTRAEAESDERLHATIVHQLRSQGWSRVDAVYEADEKLSRLHARRAALQESAG